MHTFNQQVTNNITVTNMNNLQRNLSLHTHKHKTYTQIAYYMNIGNSDIKSLVTKHQIESLIKVDYILLSLCMCPIVT